MNTILGELGKNPKFCEYIKTIESKKSPIAISGLTDVGMTQMISATREFAKRPILVITYNEIQAQKILKDIKYFTDNKAGHMVQIKTPDLGGINNIVEAILYCKSNNMGAYQGGTCNETDRSAQICAHIAMATGPDQILAKPGMGVDEGMMIVYNEMQRILALDKLMEV